jgi:sulfoxide reductase catalytic subunit YedY
MNDQNLNPSPGEPPEKITEPAAYFNRRNFLRAGAVVATAAATTYVYEQFNRHPSFDVTPGTNVESRPLASIGVPTTQDAQASATTQPAAPQPSYSTDEPQTPYELITHFNNFYEFSTDKEGVAERIGRFTNRPWKVVVDGLVAKPQTFDIDDLLKVAPAEERVYRMRCVEAWSMVIPWNGYSLSRLLSRVEPRSSARYVAFESLVDGKRFPNQSPEGDNVLPWPYVEGLRIDEAMHPLTILASGIYGRELPAQDGAPVRLVVPWKYGFKGIKSIVRISVTDRMPPTTWNKMAPGEYGFYANVNPAVDHPRWSQASEQRIGDPGGHRRATLPFNGYADQVASLYSGMDLRANY